MAAWAIAVLAHLVAFGLALALRIEFKRPVTQFVQLPPEPELPAYVGPRSGREPVTPSRRGAPPQPLVQTLAPPAADTTVRAPVAAPSRARPGFVALPSPGDGRLWVNPRPGLPADVADAIYGDRAPGDSAVVARLRAMVDSLNEILDSEQQANRLPAWVTRGGEGKPVWGLDSSGLYVAGIKIPGPVLALLGSLLPPGNYDEAVRQRHLAEMRADLMQAAARTKNLEMFRRYVRELRARKQAERDAQRRQRGDTATVQP